MPKMARLLRHLASVVVVLLFVLPLYWMVVAALRQPGLPPPRTIEWWPAEAQWSNFEEIFHILPMARYIKNSLIVVAVAVPATLLTASSAGFAMAQLPAGLQRRLLQISVILLMVPGASVWLFRYQILSWLGLIDTLWALILPAFAASSPFFVLLFFWTFRRVPAEIFEAAQLDGASAWTTWWRLGQPLARPTAIGVAVLAFALYWSDFVSPVLYIYRPELYTLPVGLQILKQLDATNWPLLMAAAAVMTAPVVVLFILLQKSFLHGPSIADLLERD